MSKVENTEIECPECKKKQELPIWSSLNSELDPEAKEELLKGNINVFLCRGCGAEGLIPVQMLYHDQAKRFCVLLFSFDLLDYEESLEAFTSDGKLKGETFPDIISYFNNMHFVFSIDELIRYVVFRDMLWEQDHTEISVS